MICWQSNVLYLCHYLDCCSPYQHNVISPVGTKTKKTQVVHSSLAHNDQKHLASTGLKTSNIRDVLIFPFAHRLQLSWLSLVLSHTFRKNCMKTLNLCISCVALNALSVEGLSVARQTAIALSLCVMKLFILQWDFKLHLGISDIFKNMDCMSGYT